MRTETLVQAAKRPRRTFWTVRALARMGYSGVEEAENCVEIVSDGWILNHKEHCKSIAELARSLESIFQ